MPEYVLSSNESVLYKGPVIVTTLKRSAELLLTNLNLIIQFSIKKGIFSKAEKEFICYPIQEIKIYDEKPQVIQKGNTVEVYFSSEFLTLQFNSILEISKFKMAIMKLLTGKSMQARGADKVKGAINTLDDALGIDTVHTVKDALENGIMGTLVGGFGKKHKGINSVKNTLANTIHTIGAVDQAINDTKITANSNNMNYEEQFAAIEKFKELFDAGIITEEEFMAKKREILGI